MAKIDLKRLQNVVQRDGKTTARCPACAAQGNDAKGEHLVVFPDGKFGCVVHAKDKKHNRLILEMAGGEMSMAYQVPVKRVVHAPSKVIKVVGRVGRSLETAAPADKTKSESSETIIADTLVDKMRPERPEHEATALPEDSTPIEEPKRRPSALDEFLAAKGLRWKSCD